MSEELRRGQPAETRTANFVHQWVRVYEGFLLPGERLLVDSTLSKHSDIWLSDLDLILHLHYTPFPHST